METTTNNNLSTSEYIIKLATEHGNAFTDNNEARIAAKGFASGYHQALTEKNIEIKELAQIVKLLLPGIHHIPKENLKLIEEYTSKSELFNTDAHFK